MFWQSIDPLFNEDAKVLEVYIAVLVNISDNNRITVFKVKGFRVSEVVAYDNLRGIVIGLDVGTVIGFCRVELDGLAVNFR